MQISHNSRDHSRKHCLISQKSLDIINTLILNNDSKGEPLLKGALDTINRDDPIKFKELEEITDEVERTFRYAQYELTKQPFKSRIFTSNDKIHLYEAEKAKYRESSINIEVVGEVVAQSIVKTTFELVKEDLQS
jgi:hypothetical protein